MNADINGAGNIIRKEYPDAFQNIKDFSYPGIGTLSYESVRYKDYNQLMVLCILSGIIVILCNMLAQAMNEQIDPRIRAKQMTEESEVVRR